MDTDPDSLYQLSNQDRDIIAAALSLLDKLTHSTLATPAQRVSIAKLQHVFSRLPRVSHGLDVTVELTSPPYMFITVETFYWWTLRIEDDALSVTYSGHYDHPDTGGDTFTVMTWKAIPGEQAELSDFLPQLRVVPDVQSFPAIADTLDLESGSYTLEITDNANPLLVDDDYDDAIRSAGGDPDNIVEDMLPEITVLATDAPATAEDRIRAKLDPNETRGKEAQFAYGISACDLCGCDLNRKSLFIDGALRGQPGWANMCADCFERHGSGIGWGVGQVYSRQTDARWRLVAGLVRG